jgi:MFS family permease
VFFFLGLLLQTVHGYSPTEAGAAMLPSIGLLLVLSPTMGRIAQRIGPQLPMTVGPLVMAGGILLLSRIAASSSYVIDVLPGVTVFGLGLAITVGPLTAAVLAAVDDRHLGVGSAFNNAVARTAGMLAVAVLPSLAGIDAHDLNPAELAGGFDRAMVVSAVLCGVIAFLTIRHAAPVQVTATPAGHGCAHPCVKDEAQAA